MVFGPFWRTTPPAIRVVVVAVVVVVILAMHRTPPLPTFWPLLLLLVLLGFSCWSRKNRWRSSRVQFGADSSGTAAHAPSADDWRRSVVVPAQPKTPSQRQDLLRSRRCHTFSYTLCVRCETFTDKLLPQRIFALCLYLRHFKHERVRRKWLWIIFTLPVATIGGPGESSSFSFENVFHWKIGSRKEPIK